MYQSLILGNVVNTTPFKTKLGHLVYQSLILGNVVTTTKQKKKGVKQYQSLILGNVDKI